MRFFQAALIFTMSLTLTSLSLAENSRRETFRQVLTQPSSKIKQCAKHGFVIYQNALALHYLNDKSNEVRYDPVKAYTWAYLATLQLKSANLTNDLYRQSRLLKRIESELDSKQIKQAKHLAETYYHLYGKHWPQPPILDLKQFPKMCRTG